MRNKIPDFTPTESKSDLDVTGSIISFIGLILLVLGILSLSKDFITSIIVIILGLVALIIFALFEVRRKRNGKVPLLDMSLFRDRNLRVGTIIMLMAYLSMGGALSDDCGYKMEPIISFSEILQKTARNNHR